MTSVMKLWNFLGGCQQLLAQTTREAFRRPYELNAILEQIYQVGVRSMPLVFVVCASSGMVMALQFGFGLSKFGGTLYVPRLVSMSIVREMGPVFACLMIAARVSAGITSELGSMKVTQQIDAIRALGTSPIKKIVVPRIVACMIAIPLLSCMAIHVGIIGGLFVGAYELGIDKQYYLQKVLVTIKLEDFLSGFGKTFFFALFIAVVSCFYGLRVSGGTKSVGTATTKSVVVSSILIMIGDYFLTKLFLVIEQWI